jgi:hypothetical protein
VELRLSGAAEELDAVGARVPGLADAELVALLREVEVISRKAHSVMLRLVAELDINRFATAEGYPSTARLIGDLLRLGWGEAA